MSPGRLLYLGWYLPLSWLARSWREGGPLMQWQTARGRSEMMAAALSLPKLETPVVGARPIEVTFLTGSGFWFQTVFCIWTLQQASGRRVSVRIFDDGSLTSEQFNAIRRVSEAAELVSAPAAEEMLAHSLPADRFPALHARRKKLPLMRKLMDVHGTSPGWRLLLDSDLLFFRNPSLLLDWLDTPSQPIRATDVINAYGYSLPTLHTLAGHPVPEKINTGILGLHGPSIDWERMESWCRALDARGSHYYQEQALVALLLAGVEHTAAPITDYVTLPCLPEARECRAVMHHYVAESKRWYFQKNWRRFAAQ